MIKDKFGNELTVGDSVYRAVTSGRTPVIYIAKVTEIRDGKLYLDDSKVPINYPSRLILVERQSPGDIKVSFTDTMKEPMGVEHRLSLMDDLKKMGKTYELQLNEVKFL